MKIDKRTWNTYATTGYAHDVANHPPSQGGVHHHQVRRINGVWQHRILQTNGRHEAHGPTTLLSDAEGMAKFITATF